MIEPEDIPPEELERMLKRAIKKARDWAMEAMGYVIEWKDGRVVKVFKDGKIEEI